MLDAMKGQDVDELVPKGYVACAGCGEWLLEGTRLASNGRCDDCMKAQAKTIDEAIMVFEVQGRTFEDHPHVRAPRRPVPIEKRYPKTDNIRRADRAKRRAIRKLTRIYQPQFELLLAAERATEGLDPKVKVETPRSMMIRDALLADIEEATEREARRVEARHLHTA